MALKIFIFLQWSFSKEEQWGIKAWTFFHSICILSKKSPFFRSTNYLVQVVLILWGIHSIFAWRYISMNAWEFDWSCVVTHLIELLLFSRGGAGDPVESLWCIKSRAWVKLALWDPNDSTLSASQSPIPEN